jgi:hypothetical protein
VYKPERKKREKRATIKIAQEKADSVGKRVCKCTTKKKSERKDRTGWGRGEAGS